MIALDALLREVKGLDVGEIEEWIEARWVLPERVASGYVFHEIDVARVHLIVELRHELLIDADAMPVVLNLLDQVYALRNRLKALAAAIETLPPETQALLREKLKE
ncbi:MAG TPA: chaperone modulator CbpM [Stellaceae bacterium]|nr:chaperone modulator CbpM [Stellaceae bacterium]